MATGAGAEVEKLPSVARLISAERRSTSMPRATEPLKPDHRRVEQRFARNRPR